MSRTKKREVPESAKKLQQATLPIRIKVPKLDKRLCDKNTSDTPNSPITNQPENNELQQLYVAPTVTTEHPTPDTQALTDEGPGTSSSSNHQENRQPLQTTTEDALQDAAEDSNPPTDYEPGHLDTQDLYAPTETGDITPPQSSPHETTQDNQNGTSDEQQPLESKHKLIIFKNSFAKMEKSDMNKLKEGILYGILNMGEVIDFDVIQNITDIKGSCLIIKLTSLGSTLALQSIVNNSIEGYKCLGPEEDNLGLLVKCLAPCQLAGIIDKNLFLKLVAIASGNFIEANTDVSYAIPPKRLDNLCTVLHLRLNYKAQLFYSNKLWKFVLPGTDFDMYCEEEIDNKRVKPALQLDTTPPLLNSEMNNLMVDGS